MVDIHSVGQIESKGRKWETDGQLYPIVDGGGFEESRVFQSIVSWGMLTRATLIRYLMALF